VSLLGAVDRLVNDDAECKKFGENGRNWVVRHASPAAAAASYEQVLNGQ